MDLLLVHLVFFPSLKQLTPILVYNVKILVRLVTQMELLVSLVKEVSHLQLLQELVMSAMMLDASNALMIHKVAVLNANQVLS